MKGESEIKKLAEEFVACKDILMAVGDENRLHLMIEMMQMGNCSGVRVGHYGKDTSVKTGGVPSSPDPEGRRHPERAQGGNKKLLLF